MPSISQKIFSIWVVLILSSYAVFPQLQPTLKNVSTAFVKVKGQQFTINNKPYFFIGTNYWLAPFVATTTKGKQRVEADLDSLQKMGITNIRLMAFAEAPNNSKYRISPTNNDKGILNEASMQALDFTLHAMQKRNMYAVVCLTNFWPWSGGMAQYLKWSGGIDSILYPSAKANSWGIYMNQAAQFYSNKKAINLYTTSITKLICRENSITKKMYKNDATIMAWQLCNEPRAMNNQKDYLSWIKNTSDYIKSIDSNHLISIGSEGYTPANSTNNIAFEEIHTFKNVDYAVAHVWIQNWEWYNPKQHDSTIAKVKQEAKDYIYNHIEIAKKLNKPFVLEEFGIARDSGSFNPTSSTINRDDFYRFVFQEIYDHCYNGNASGVNFWAFAGKGRPKNIGKMWKSGDDFIGDPPHEEQGWYSVYDKDFSTIEIIKEFTTKMKYLVK